MWDEPSPSSGLLSRLLDKDTKRYCHGAFTAQEKGVSHRIKRKLVPEVPYRKFVFLDGELAVGHLIGDAEHEDYWHYSLIKTLLQGGAPPSPPVRVAEGVVQAARQALAQWAERNDLPLRFETEESGSPEEGES